MGDLDERKRDFGRTCAAAGFYVVTPTESTPVDWSSSTKSTGSMDKETAEAISSEFQKWLEGAVQTTTKASIEDGLLERCVANVAVSNGVDFAIPNQFPMMMKQPAFVLIVSAKGEVRVVWLSFITDEATMKSNPSMEAGPYMVKMLTDDLNSSTARAAAAGQGVSCQYVAMETKEQNMKRYIEKQAAAFSRAAVENQWGDLMA